MRSSAKPSHFTGGSVGSLLRVEGSFAPISEPPSPALLQQLAAISVAISVGCLVEANVGGTLRRVLGIKQQADGLTTLLYHNEARQMVVFFVKPGGRLIFKITLAQETEAAQ